MIRMHMNAGTAALTAVAAPFARTPFGGVARGVTFSFHAFAPATA